MTKSDLYSIDENGVPQDKWIFDEILGADDLPDPYAVDLSKVPPKPEKEDNHGA
jgi:hypothetical protein